MLASVNGLVNISIGGLASKANMSRSGLFAHFLSKEQLQVEIIEFATKLFNKTILEPCRQLESPVARFRFLQSEFPSWYEKTEPQIPGGCIFLMAALEFDDRPGKIRDLVLKQQNDLIDFFRKTHDDAVAAGEFVGNTNTDNFAYAFYSFYMGYNHYKKFFGDENARGHFDHVIGQMIRHAQGLTIIPGPSTS